MMALPQAQYVLADPSTPVTAAANSSQVKTVSKTKYILVFFLVFFLAYAYIFIGYQH